jgi:hypothetical protein
MVALLYRITWMTIKASELALILWNPGKCRPIQESVGF